VTATELLAELARQGFSLSIEGDGIRVRPASCLGGELRQAVRTHKAALLALLAGAPAPWDEARADATLSEVLGVVGRAEARHASPARRAVLAIYRDLAQRYHRERDALLYEAPAAVNALLTRWAEGVQGAEGGNYDA
jgi:hypothetical protein